MKHLTALRGGRLAWDDAGPADAPGVLLVMGLGARGLAWRRTVEGLKDRFHLAWFDHRGVGESDPATHTVTMQTLAEDAVQVANAAGFQHFHVVGVSMGGMIAQHVALAHRDRIASLTLVATHPGGWRYRIPPLGSLRLVAATQHPNARVRADQLARLLFPQAYLATVDAAEMRQALREEFGTGMRMATLISQLGAVRGHNTQRDLKQLAGVPTLVLQPGSDNLVRPAGSEALAQLIPGARLHHFAEAGHGLVRQCAREVNVLLADHFAAAGQRQPAPSAG